MRALLQRVTQARVSVNGEVVGAIGRGWTILVSAAPDDTAETARKLAERIAHLRCFEDESGKMNRSALDVEADMLVISQFTH